MKKNESRRAAVFVFARWRATGEFPVSLLPEGPDRPFVQDIVYTAIRRKRAIRFYLERLVKRWPAGELESLLFIGAAQILFMPDVPDYAAVSETVSAAKSCSNPSIPRVVNGVLRNLIRRRAELDAQFAEASADVRESFPSKLYARWQKRYGSERAEELMKWHNEPAETYLAWSDGRFTLLPRAQAVTDVEGYKEGKFIVQDPGTAAAIELLSPAAGEKILDLCAAPGGKTVQIAWRGAEVCACEINPKRRLRLIENLKRVNVEAEVLSSPASAKGRMWDKVLVDAPCGNTGVFRRRPDARWGWSIAKQKELCALQAEILDVASSLVKPGGILVYSTCSNEPEENAMQISAFLERHPDFTLDAQKENLPIDSKTDGAYAARLRRLG
jgi:16S rRNA (cytosine967-C5)-methyltransferase